MKYAASVEPGERCASSSTPTCGSPASCGATVVQADYILSGDGHLLDLGQYAGIPIVTVRDFFAGEFPGLLD
jgi:hypothetical protein